jgi:hypothetical protein
MRVTLKKTRELVDQALAVYDIEAHRHLTLEFAHDPRAAAMNYMARSNWHLGRVGMECGDADAPSLMRQSIETAELIGVLRFGSFHLGLLEDGISKLGDHTEAQAVIAAALKLQEFTQDVPLKPDLYRLRTKVMLRASRTATDEATADLEHAIKLSQAIRCAVAGTACSDRTWPDVGGERRARQRRRYTGTCL